jgi:glucokinase
MILAGDIGGTKTLIGLFEPRTSRPAPIDVQSFPTTEYPGLPDIIEAFFAGTSERPRISAAAFGVAGPVINQTAQMTNVEWCVDAGQVASGFNLPQVTLLNDLEAMAYSARDQATRRQHGHHRRGHRIGRLAAPPPR